MGDLKGRAISYLVKKDVFCDNIRILGLKNIGDTLLENMV